jgi:class 3 adenylate cyclase
MRQTCSPSALKRLYAANANIDVRPILPDIRVPTLILHRRFERAVHRGNARYMADHMPEAIYIELPGRNHICWLGDVAGLVDAIAHFAEADAPAQPATDGTRRLVTALFTDIVGSTEALARLGDARWRELLDRHDATARSKVGEYQGRFVKSTGDGMLAVFGGPTRAILCARDLSDSLAGLELPVRCGLHVGEVETRGEDVSGMAVHIAARIMDHAEAGEVLVSRTLADLTVGSGLAMETAGRHAFKGLPGEIEVLRVAAAG